MNKIPAWLWIVAGLVLFTGGSAAMKYAKYRGIRNNNPGNIERGTRWEGMAQNQIDERFITFLSPEYGIRAMAKILKNYQAMYGLNTLRGIATRWAPPSENNTEAYIDSLERSTGIPADAEIQVSNILPRLIPAMILQENGIQPYDAATISRGVSMA